MVDKIWYNMEELIGGSEERGINRNILECKDGSRIKIMLHWLTVLIETYWNVKSIHVEEPFQIAGINRNILECKVYGSGFGIHATTLY